MKLQLSEIEIMKLQLRLLICLLLAFLPVICIASSSEYVPWLYDFCIDDLCYKINDETSVTLVSPFEEDRDYDGNVYHCGMTDIVIPSEVTNDGNTYQVVAIGHHAFQFWDMQSVAIPNTVKSIGKSAFLRCSKLANVTMSSSLEELGESAFSNCSLLKSIALPNTLKVINGATFYGCTSMESIEVGDEIAEIGYRAFYNCSKLQSIHLTACLSDLGNEVFYACQSLKDVTLSGELSVLNKRVFASCASLKSVSLPATLTTIDEQAFQNCSSLESVSLPVAVANINSQAFQNCSSLKTIALDDALLSIGSSAFENCTSLTTVQVGSHLQSVGEKAFMGCAALQEFDAGLSPVTVKEYAFDGCSSMTRVVIGNSGSAESGAIIDRYTFNGCTSLATAILGDNISAVGDYAFASCSNLNTLTLGNSLQSIGQYAFYHSGIQKLELPSTTTTIGSHAFDGCAQLVEATLGDNVKTLEDYAFWKCSAMTNIAMGKSLTELKRNTFGHCSSLQSIILPPTIKNIGRFAFYHCERLESIDLGSSLETITQEAFEGCAALKALDLPASVATIGDQAFDGCEALEVINFSSSLQSIGEYAFSSCKALTSISLKNSLQSIGRYAFSGCSVLTSIDLGSSIQSLGDHAFNGCYRVDAIVIPGSLTDIGIYAFMSCGAAKRIEVAKGNPSYDSRNDCNAIIETMSGRLIRGCVNTVIPDGVTSIGSYAFSQVLGLKEIVLPPSVKILEGAAFAYCSNLETVDFGNVEEILNSPFLGCSAMTTACLPNTLRVLRGGFGAGENLKTVYLPSSITTMPVWYFSDAKMLSITGEGAFTLSDPGASRCNISQNIPTICIGAGITSLQGGPRFNASKASSNIYSYSVIPPTIDEKTFNAYNATLHVPKGTKTAYFAADYWNNFVNLVDDAELPQSLSIDTDTVRLKVGQQARLKGIITPEDATPATIIWSTTKAAVATVNGTGLVTAQGPGVCNISASCVLSTAKPLCHVIVEDDTPNVIQLDKETLTLRPEAIETITPTFTVEAVPIVVASSDTEVALAKVVNDKVQVMGVKPGKATVVVSPTEGDTQSASCLITVLSSGDIDDDGQIDVNDISMLIDALLRGVADDESAARYDVAEPFGVIDVADLSVLLNIVLGKSE